LVSIIGDFRYAPALPGMYVDNFSSVAVLRAEKKRSEGEAPSHPPESQKHRDAYIRSKNILHSESVADHLRKQRLLDDLGDADELREELGRLASRRRVIALPRARQAQRHCAT
jgi:hypothetical protein